VFRFLSKSGEDKSALAGRANYNQKAMQMERSFKFVVLYYEKTA
jgi:hypothetical protein